MEWIVLDECLPDFDQEVLVCIDSEYGRRMAVAVLNKPLSGAPKGWQEWNAGDAISGSDAELISGKITHWMCLPNLPTRTEQDTQ